ncbi:MAG: hypothetical protein B7Z10_03420 [Rhodobacterales bacterium 32-66-7]|nr:MAG: hypothetical protein B7Z31_00335 [Rhodobacterales bacterium 12-65-15]OYX26403.1 MAG: hypothetical protein B7Z10_03420 [Rhodobacterales bacterium 32-66-7]
MAYRSSPRPNFTAPTAIPYRDVTRYLWGDDDSGRVNDWIYASSGKIHQLVFGFPAGGGFRHSESFRTVFGADEVLIVLQGRMVLANPETGEVRIVETGQSVVFGKDTWHNAFALPGEELRVLEYFAPPPSTGTSGKYAATKPYVATPRFARDEYLGRWPIARTEAETASHFTVLDKQDRLWSMSSGDPRALTGIISSTPQLTAAEMLLAPGGRTAALRHKGDAVLYVGEGRLNLMLPQIESGPDWFELSVGDGFFVPEGSVYQLYNMGTDPVQAFVGVAPDFGAGG